MMVTFKLCTHPDIHQIQFVSIFLRTNEFLSEILFTSTNPSSYYYFKNIIFCDRFSPVLAISYQSDPKVFEASTEKLLKFIEDQPESKDIRLSCGHINDNMEAGDLRGFYELLRKVNCGEAENKGNGLFAEYYSDCGDFAFMIRRLMAFDRVLKPFVKIFR